MKDPILCTLETMEGIPLASMGIGLGPDSPKSVSYIF